MTAQKKIWKRDEIPIGDYLMTFQDSLREDFMKGFSTLEEAVLSDSNKVNITLDRPGHSFNKESYSFLVQSRLNKSQYFRPNISAWKNVSFKYTLNDKTNNIIYKADSELRNRFPTAFKLMDEFSDDCPILNYSILEPKSAIFRHTGPENRSGRFIRIHIPLVVPIGDVFLEVDSEEVTWDNLFGFNNQFSHSAYNLTDEWRMIFLIDIDRERAGLEPGAPYDPNYFPKPFYRKIYE